MNKRLFTFGCSFTSYLWPTWADILGREFDFFQNWGKGGAGNQYILNALVECHHRNQLRPDDTICIMWTNVCREDRYVNNEWITPGNIFSQDTYDKKFVRQFADVRGYYIRDLSSIWLADQLLEKIGCKTYFFSMVDMVNPMQYHFDDVSEQINDLIEIYDTTLKKIRPSVHRVIFNLDWYSRPINSFTSRSSSLRIWEIWYNAIRDESWPRCDRPEDFDLLPESIQIECKQNFDYEGISKKIYQASIEDQKRRFALDKRSPRSRDEHPIPIEHLEYLIKVCPEIKLSQSTVDWVNQINTLGLQGQSYDHIYVDTKSLASHVRRW